MEIPAHQRQSTANESKLLRELSRVGVRGRHLEPERNLTATFEQGEVVIREEGFVWRGREEEALALLAGLPSNVGVAGFRAAFSSSSLKAS